MATTRSKLKHPRGVDEDSLKPAAKRSRRHDEEDNEKKDGGSKASLKHSNCGMDEDCQKPAAKKSSGVGDDLKAAAPHDSSSQIVEEATVADSMAVVPSLNEDALSLVMEFLSPRDLYNIALTCKGVRDRVTTTIVVRSALIHGGFPKQTCEILYDLMSKKAMHVPSPLRLLRRVNGKRCEFCFSKRTNHVRPSLGVFACWDCVTNRGLTKPWKTSWARYRHHQAAYSAILEHPRVATNGYSDKKYMWVEQKKDITGEKIGPIALFDDVDRMFNHKSGVDDYIKNVLGAPDEDEYRDFNNAFEENKTRAKKAVAERAEKKRKASEKKKESRKANINKIISELESFVDESFRDTALTRSDIFARTTKDPCIKFAFAYVDGLMRPYIVTPSKIRKKIIKDIANDINAKLRLIVEKRFLNLDFLSEDDPFESKLKLHYGNNYSDFDFFTALGDRCGFKRMANEKFFSLLEDDKLVEALAHLKGNDLSRVLLPDDATDQEEKSLRQLARNIWRAKLVDHLGNDDSERFSEVFVAGQECFSIARRAIDSYYNWLQENPRNFSEFLSESSMRERSSADAAWEDMEAIRRCVALKKKATESSWALSFLLKEDFRGLNEEMRKRFDTLFW